MTIYFNKYLKYKNKYLNLQNIIQIGGSTGISASVHASVSSSREEILINSGRHEKILEDILNKSPNLNIKRIIKEINSEIIKYYKESSIQLKRILKDEQIQNYILEFDNMDMTNHYLVIIPINYPLEEPNVQMNKIQIPGPKEKTWSPTLSIHTIITSNGPDTSTDLRSDTSIDRRRDNSSSSFNINNKNNFLLEFDIFKLKGYLEAGIDINIVDEHEMTCLMYQSVNNLKGVQLLLSYEGINVNLQNEIKQSALHIACYNSRPDIISLLLNFGADRNIRDINGQLPYNLTTDSECHRILDKQPVATSSQIKAKRTELKELISKYQIEENKPQEFFSYFSPNNNFEPSSSSTPNSCGTMSDKTIKQFIEEVDDKELEKMLHSGRITNINCMNKDNMVNALIRNSANNREKSVELLLLWDSIDVNMRNKDGESALSVACLDHHPEIVKLLLSYGANPYLKNKIGKQPSDIHIYDPVKPKSVQEALRPPDIDEEKRKELIHRNSRCRMYLARDNRMKLSEIKKRKLEYRSRYFIQKISIYWNYVAQEKIRERQIRELLGSKKSNANTNTKETKAEKETKAKETKAEKETKAKEAKAKAEKEAKEAKAEKEAKEAEIKAENIRKAQEGQRAAELKKQIEAQEKEKKRNDAIRLKKEKDDTAAEKKRIAVASFATTSESDTNNPAPVLEPVASRSESYTNKRVPISEAVASTSEAVASTSEAVASTSEAVASTSESEANKPVPVSKALALELETTSESDTKARKVEETKRQMMYEIISNKFVNHPAVQELLRIDIRSLVIDNIEQIITLLKTQGILKYMACFKHDMDNNEQYEKIQYVILFSTSYFNRELIRHGVIFPTKGGTAFKFLLSYFNFNEIQENKIKSIVGYIGKCMYGTNDIDYSLWCDPRIYGSFSPEDLIEFRNCMCNMLAYKLYEIINYNYILDEVMYQSPKPENTGGGGGSAVSLSKPDIQESFVYKLALNYYGSPVVLTDINPVETDNNTIQYIQIPITILINGGVYYGHIYIDYYDIFRQDKEKYADKYKPESFFGRKFNNYIKYFNAIDSVLGKKK